MTTSIFLLLAGSAGFALCAAYPSRIDSEISSLLARLRRWVESKRNQSPSPSSDLLLLSRLIASARAGVSLDSAISRITREPSLPPDLKFRLTQLMEGRAQTDFLSAFLDGALRTGIPVLSPLLSFQKTLQAERRVRLRVESLTAQSRAQAEVLSWLPWVLLAALATIDHEWLVTATKHSFSWALWAISLALVGSGRIWMRSLLRQALLPRGRAERLQEEQLPRLLLRLSARLSLGEDAETALESSLRHMNDPSLAQEFHLGRAEIPEISALRGLLGHAASTGAPLREDLLAFHSDLNQQTEARWEERAQRLPVVMMAPLFLCFFPASLLVLVALLAPLGNGLL